MKTPEFAIILLVGVGGFLGSVCRYLAGTGIQAACGVTHFPLGTFFVNVTGCLAIGFLSQLVEQQNSPGPGPRAFLVTGVLGGYTTFSAFGNETVNLIRGGHRLSAGLNLGGQIAFSLVAVALGRMLALAIRR